MNIKIVLFLGFILVFNYSSLIASDEDMKFYKDEKYDTDERFDTGRVILNPDVYIGYSSMSNSSSIDYTTDIEWEDSSNTGISSVEGSRDIASIRYDTHSIGIGDPSKAYIGLVHSTVEFEKSSGFGLGIEFGVAKSIMNTPYLELAPFFGGKFSYSWINNIKDYEGVVTSGDGVLINFNVGMGFIIYDNIQIYTAYSMNFDIYTTESSDHTDFKQGDYTKSSNIQIFTHGLVLGTNIFF